MMDLWRSEEMELVQVRWNPAFFRGLFGAAMPGPTWEYAFIH